MQLNRFFKSLLNERYTYTVNTTAQDTTDLIAKLLNTSGFLTYPNITGKVKGNTFEATHRWSFVYSRGGGSPIYLDGVISKISEGTTKVDIVAYPGFSMRFALFIIAVMACALVLDPQASDKNAASYYQALPVMLLIIVILSGVFMFFTGIIYYMKNGLRATFQDGINATPDERE